jgi:hypothetical protein
LNLSNALPQSIRKVNCHWHHLPITQTNNQANRYPNCVKSRIILTPEHAKRLLAALKDNIRKFEDSYGDIRHSDEPEFPFMNFGGPVGEA